MIVVIHVSVVPNNSMKLKWILVKVVPEFFKRGECNNVTSKDSEPIPGSRVCVLTLDCFLIDAFDSVGW